MERKRRFPFPAVGGSSLLVIFGVLCLVVFALLALSSAQADSRLTEAALSSTEGWYEANLRAEEILSRLRGGEDVDGVVRQGNRCLYQCAFSPNQALVVEVEVSGTDYTVLRWQAVSTAEWETEDGLGLWPGA